MKKYIVILIAVLFLASFVSAISTDSILLKVSLNKGDIYSSSILLNSNISESVDISVKNLEGVSIDESLFFIKPGDVKGVEVMFNSSLLEPGVYVGLINFKGKNNELDVPVIFGVESNVLFDLTLNIPPLYAEIIQGGRILSNIKIFDLTALGNEGLGTQSVDVFYYIYSVDGSPIFSESERVVVSHSSSFSKTLILPDRIKEGTYVIASMVRFGDSYGVSSDVFNVVSSEESFRGLSLSWAIALLVIVLFLGLFMLFFLMLIKDRDRFLMDLKKYHDEELTRQKELLSIQQRFLVEGGKISPAEAKRIGKIKLKELKKKQKEQKKIFKKISKKGDVSEMEKRLKEWKKKGYNTLVLESKLDNLTKKEMKDLLIDWKNKGYKNS